MESCSRIKGEMGRIWKEYFEDLYDIDGSVIE